MRARLGFSVFFIAALLCSAGMGADTTPIDWFYRAWQTEDGLPDNSISGVAQSPDGFLWVATKGGLMRFNGSEFKTMPLKRFPGLPSRAIRAMFLDSKGRLWLAMERGPLIRVGTHDVRAFFPRDGLFKKRIVSITEDKQGHIWVGFSDAICRIDGDEITKFGRKSAIPLGGALTLSRDGEGQVWLAKNREIGVLASQGFENRSGLIKSKLLPDRSQSSGLAGNYIAIGEARSSGLWLTVSSELMLVREGGRPETVAQLPKDCAVQTIFEDNGGAVWIGTAAHGLLRYGNGLVRRVPTSHPSITAITQDQEENIWVGTDGGGLNLVKPRSVELIRGTQEAPISTIQSVAVDPTGKVWSVTDDGQLVSSIDGNWTNEPENEALRNVQASCVTTAANGRIWIGTRAHGLLSHYDGKWSPTPLRPGKPERLVRSVLAASNGDVWAATDSPFELHRLRDGEVTSWTIDKPIEYIRAITEGADGTIWAASSIGRVLRVEGDEIVDEDAIIEPLPLSVRTLHGSSDGSLWIGYAGEGLGHLKDGRYHRITTDDGLYDDYISQVIEDGQGSLWITANRGLFQVDLEDLLAVSAGNSNNVRSRIFGRNDGLPSLQPVRNFSPSAARSPDGNLWFAMSRGLLKVRPDRIKENLAPPPVVLEKVTIDGLVAALYRSRSMMPEEFDDIQTDLSQASPSLRIEPGHDRMEIDFAALSLTSPENVHFLYRLSPFDRRWMGAKSIQSATYPRLPPGHYEFQVLACNNVGVWNEQGATLSIEVVPFFWETWWFKIGGGIATALAAGAIVFFLLHWRHDRQLKRIGEKRALEQERSRIARDIHDDLGASLTRITLLSQSAPGEEPPQELFDKIHATARHLMRSMEEVVWAVNPEHDTFDALVNYMSNYGQGFLGIAGVRCRLEMPMVPPERPLSAQVRHNLFLAFKEALNNAVKYSQASEVRISLQPGDTHFSLRISDNGVGIDFSQPSDPSRHCSGNGLANMKARMEEIGGSCELQSSKEEGTTVIFDVPFKPQLS